jgi:serine/threonine protein kinase/tetratricopeptide (TPR) repeat protein
MGTSESPVESIFFAALQRGSPEERARYLEEACAADTGLRRRVERLLGAHLKVGNFLELPPSCGPSVSDAPASEQTGATIGPYKLLQKIGEGGMGTVFMAEQAHPVKRTVALKLIKAGMDSRQVIARFAAEQHALALMEHPNIAKVLDAGTAESGRPYFVMELVKGVPITRYCDERHLTPRQRLELFVPVCQAVQHAHQKGIIHRDIKPSNVLIALYDDKPVPKVIDFGVAKATGPQLTEQTLFTAFGQMLGTVQYMSPEQAGLNQLDIDTRSDIYSLGVLLYELLTGSTPLEHRRVIEVALLDVLRLVREEEVQRPSTRLSTTGQLASISANRGLEPRKLNVLVRGELDWIVMRSLEKDRNRRYETVSGLARDVERYLQDEAVEACPPSAVYRFRKFVRRHKAGVAISSTLGIFVLLAVAGLVVNNRLVTREKDQKEAALTRALREKQRADENLVRARQAVSKYLTLTANNELLQQADFTELRRNLLESALPFFQEFVEQRRDDAELEAERGRAYGELALLREDLGELDQALAAHEQRRAIFDRLLAEFPSKPAYQQELANTYRNVGNVQLLANAYAEAESSFRRAVALLEPLASQYPREGAYRQDLAGAYSNLGVMLRRMDKQADALELQQKGVTLREGLVADFSNVAEYRRDLAGGLVNQGLVFSNLGQHEKALTSIGRAMDLLKKLAEEHPGSPQYQKMWGDTLDNQSVMLCDLGRRDEGLAALEQAVRIHEKLAANFRSVPSYRYGLATSLMNLSMLQADMGRRDEGLATCDKAISILESLSSDSPKVVEYRQILALTYRSQGELHRRSNRFEPALVSLRKGLALQEKFAADNPSVPRLREDLALTHSAMGEIYSQTGRFNESAAAYEKALPIREELFRGTPSVTAYAVNLASTYGGIGNLKLAQRKSEDALAMFDKALSLLARVLAAEPRSALARNYAGKIHMSRATALSELARHPEALKDLDQALAFDDGENRIALRLDRATTLAHMQAHAQATAEVEALSQMPDLSAQLLRDAAAVYAVCTPQVRDDPDLAEKYAASAVALLRRGFEKDYRAIAKGVADDSDLDVLRSRQDFRKLMKEWEGRQH